MKVSQLKVVIAVGGLAVSLSAGAGVAAAQPGVDQLVNTNCSYPQLMAALDAHSPALAGEFNSQPLAQSMLRQFLASPTDQRREIASQALATPTGQQYLGSMVAVTNTCSSF